MMIRKYLLLLLLVMGLITQVVNAHPGGHGPVSEKEAIFIASQVSIQFIEFDPGLGFGKLTENWKSVPETDRAMHKVGEGYYIVSINNRAEKKTLYVLLSIDGEVFDANFSGVFPGLK